MKQRIIIIGGMGPQASLELHRPMIQQALADGAKDGTDFPHIVHLSLPVPDWFLILSPMNRGAAKPWKLS